MVKRRSVVRLILSALTVKKIAAAYLGILFLAFLAKMVELNGPVEVLKGVAIAIGVVTIPLALIVLLDADNF